MLRLTWFDYGSRPTAVNLSDAAEKFRSLVSKIAETADKAHTIFQVGHGSHFYELSHWMTDNAMVLDYRYTSSLDCVYPV